MIGVRRANRQQTTLPSSVLSADSMHIGVLAAAAHAAANRSPFTIFYNPRACPSEFVIPLATYQKAIYGTQLSVGMRFGMMFETEESGKRRYMGTIVSTSDLDPLRWPGSKWRNLQVEWDEPGCCDKQNRVSSWEIETPENLFIFPSLLRVLNGHYTLDSWEQKLTSQYATETSTCNHAGTLAALQQQSPANGDLIADMKAMQAKLNQKNPGVFSEGTSLQSQNPPQSSLDQSAAINVNTTSHAILPGKLNNLTKFGSQATGIEDKLAAGFVSPYNLVNQLTFANQNQSAAQLQTSPRPMQPPLESLLYHSQQTDMPNSDFNSTNGSLPFLDNDECIFYQSCQPFAATLRSQGLCLCLEMWDNSLNNCRLLPQVDQLTSSHQGPGSLNCISNSSSLRDLSDESNNQSGIYGCPNIDVGSGVSTVIDPSVSSTILDEFSTLKNADFHNPSDCLLGNLSSSQDLQSQITSASLGDSQAFSRQDLADNSGGTSSSNIDLDESSLLQNNSSWHQVVPPVRTYTKVQKTGSVGRSIDVTSFKNYEELCSAIECMFGLEGLLNDPRGSGWKLVYVDYENDVLLVGDDPWEEFVGCVRCIRILSPTEVQQMSEEGMKLLNGAAMQGINGTMSEGGRT
ncbi:auxin response factor 5 isoform X1 [Prunus yedoensis var. nudiflora]|uniref:Auxin-responsive protein n=1 Tax=Prunus yedoensis var. nudiflora TaxID=2094558 RepID=A0A314ZW75_PRUYE|nr:auxin response factor 5 isoform X1 [Prunus yedoensis var. nudiflora]